MPFVFTLFMYYEAGAPNAEGGRVNTTPFSGACLREVLHPWGGLRGPNLPLALRRLSLELVKLNQEKWRAKVALEALGGDDFAPPLPRPRSEYTRLELIDVEVGLLRELDEEVSEELPILSLLRDARRKFLDQGIPARSVLSFLEGFDRWSRRHFERVEKIRRLTTALRGLGRTEYGELQEAVDASQSLARRWETEVKFPFRAALDRVADLGQPFVFDIVSAREQAQLMVQRESAFFGTEWKKSGSMTLVVDLWDLPRVVLSNER